MLFYVIVSFLKTCIDKKLSTFEPYKTLDVTLALNQMQKDNFLIIGLKLFVYCLLLILLNCK